MNFAEELTHVCPVVDEDGTTLQWTHDVDSTKPAILAMLALFSASFRAGWNAAHPHGVSDSEKLDVIMARRAGQDVAALIRRDVGTGTVRTVVLIARENSQTANIYLLVGGRRHSKTVKRALYDVGIRTLRGYWAGPDSAAQANESPDAIREFDGRGHHVTHVFNERPV
jgi:hypothetical protein